MALTTGTGLTSLSVLTLPGETNPIYPRLQMQDGSYVGFASDSAGHNFMTAFDTAGNVRWTVANDSPWIATDDGGLIGSSGTNYDQNGNAAGAVSNVLTESWRGNMYQRGSVERLSIDPFPVAQSLWVVAFANLAGNKSSGRPWYFKLVWKNDCATVPSPCGFMLHPDNPQVLPSLAVTLASQSGFIRGAALNALKKAFNKYPATVVNVSEGRGHTGDHWANVIDGYSLGPNGGKNCGLVRGFPDQR